jgi:hypothetical protein
MSRIIVEYNPNLSKEVQKIIRENVTASMMSNDESSCQYAIEQCEDAILEYDDVYEDDLNTIRQLISEGVHYLEF